MPLRADNGAILEPKEPIVLDTQGNPIHIPDYSKGSQNSNFKEKWKIQGLKFNSAWSIPLLILGIGAFLIIGTFFSGVILIIAIGLFVYRFIKSIFA